ncbi:fumarate hydratase C-terminal domain-containing protein [Escherichia coli]
MPPVLLAQRPPDSRLLCESTASAGEYDHAGEGNRSQQVTIPVKTRRLLPWQYRWSGRCLGAGKSKSLECVEYPELEMEAIWKIEVENFRRLSLWMIKEMTSSSRYNWHQCTRCVK